MDDHFLWMVFGVSGFAGLVVHDSDHCVVFLSFYNWTPRPLSAEADRADVDAEGLVVRADVVGRDIDDR